MYFGNNSTLGSGQVYATPEVNVAVTPPVDSRVRVRQKHEVHFETTGTMKLSHLRKALIALNAPDDAEITIVSDLQSDTVSFKARWTTDA